MVIIKSHRPSGSPVAKKGAVAGALLALAALAGISIEDAGKVVTDVDRHESGGRQRLAAFRDSVGIWTICGGIITWPDGRRVKQGDTATVEQCHEITAQQILERAGPLVRGIPQLRGRPNQVRALVDESFNCGVASVVNGSVGASIRAGAWSAASKAILACDRGTFRKPTPGRDCVPKKKRPGWWSCRIPGLTARRLDNRRLFDLGRPADGVRVPAGTGAQRVRGLSDEAAEDGYVFQVKQFTRLQVAVEVHEFATREAMRDELRRRFPRLGGVDRILAFSSWDGNGCTLFILDPATAYEPAYIGHELSHCLHGGFHPGQDTRR